MLEAELRELQRDLDRIARGPEVCRPPDWRKTKILNNDGILADARKFLDPDWWKRAEPRDASNREILRMVERGELLHDGVVEENVEAGGRGVTAEEVVEHQHNQQKVGVDEETWRSYMGEPKDDARQWLKELSAKIDTNVPDRKGWWGTLRDHVHAKPNGARIRDLDPGIVELCLKNLCTQ